MLRGEVIPRFAARGLHFGRRHGLLELTGARQTGKTTLARAAFPDLRYVTMDDPRERDRVGSLSAAEWPRAVGDAIIDEAHKEPRLFDTLKAAFDAGTVKRTLLLGSAQIVMLRRVRETLAGRVSLLELYPFLAAELAAEGPLRDPLFAT